MQEKSEEEDVFLKLWHQAMAEVDFLARKIASAASCDEEELVQEKEQCSRVPLMIEKKDLVGASLSMQGAELKQGSHPNLMQGEVPEVSGLKEDAETMVDRMHSMLEEELGLKEEKVTGVEKDRHELSPLVADKLLPPDREASVVGALTSGGNVKYKLLLEEEMSKEEMDLEAEWIKSRPKENFAEAAEQPDFKKLMLRQVNLNIKEVKKHADAKQLNYIMKEEINEVGEVVMMLGKTAQMEMMSKLMKEEVGEVVTKANPEAKEKFKKCDNSFPHEPGAESESSKIKEIKEIDPWAHWIRWRRYGAAECFPRLSKKAEEAEAQTSSREEKTKFSHPEMKVETVLYTAEQSRLLAEVEAWGEEDAKPGLHVELIPAKVEAWGHEDAEADIFERSESKQEAEEKLAAHTTKAEAVERRLPRLEKGDSNSMIDKLAENSASNQLEEELKKEQGGEPHLIIDKQNLVEMSLSKKVEMKWMHALKAEAVQVRNVKLKLMKEELLEFCKQCLEEEECEKEGCECEALQLLVDEQAANAG